MGTDMVPRNGSGTVARQEFGAQQLEVRHETTSVAVAAQAKAAIESRYIMARQIPRDWDTVRVRLLSDMSRPGFAAAARYSVPIGGKNVEGWTIRFAEVAMRWMGNLMPEITVVFDNSQQRILRVSLTDLESNLTYVKDVVIAKTVERRKPKAGTTVLGSRLNSNGDMVYIVEATDEEFSNKEGALVSKALRNHAMRMVPGDILDECLEVGAKTVSNQDAQDPDAARKKLIDSFASLNIMPLDLKAYLEHDVGSCSPAELVDLRAKFAAVREGATTWPAILDAKDEDAASSKKSDEPQTAPPLPPAKARTTADLKAREKAKKAEPHIKIKGPDGEILAPFSEDYDGPPADFDDRQPGEEG